MEFIPLEKRSVPGQLPGWLLFGGISLSLVLREGSSIAPVILMFLGAWSLFKSTWRQRNANSTMRIVLICFAGYAVGSCALSAAHGDSLGHFEQYLPFIGAILIAVALQTNALCPNLFVGGFAVAAILAGIASIVQVVQAHQTHRASLFTSLNTFGMLGVLYAVICTSALGWSTNQNNKRWRPLLICGSLGGLAISLLSGSKGSWLALLIIGPCAFAHATKNFGSLARIKWAFFALIYLTAICILPHSAVVSRVQTFIEEGDAGRLSYWREGMGMARTQPVIGVGRSQISRHLSELTTQQLGTSLPTEFTGDLHNEYLDIFAARGVLGLALVLSVLVIPLALLARIASAHDSSTRDPAITGMLFIAAFAICGLTDVQFQITAKRMIYVLGTLIFIHFASTKSGQDQLKE